MSKYAVIDLEMCHVNRKLINRKYFCKNEIIQIGAVLLDELFEVQGEFATFVSPRYGTVDTYIQKLTGIAPADTESAPDIEKALEAFTLWLPDDVILVAWSDSDKFQLRKEMTVKNIKIPKLRKLLDTYIDCQVIYGKKMNSPKVYRLSEALIIADIDYEDGAHDACVDAYNTALLFKKLQSEKELVLSRYYRSEENDVHLFYNPFAELLKELSEAV